MASFTYMYLNIYKLKFLFKTHEGPQILSDLRLFSVVIPSVPIVPGKHHISNIGSGSN